LVFFLAIYLPPIIFTVWFLSFISAKMIIIMSSLSRN